MPPDSSEAPEFRTLKGRRIVIGVLAFGVLMVAAMWLYWEMYTRPFRPLQEAIHATFPDSSPRVVGGQHKSHKGESPALLRIVVRVPFDPETAGEATIDGHVAKLHELARKHLDLAAYDLLEIHLIHRVPEEETRRVTVEIPLQRQAGASQGAA